MKKKCIEIDGISIEITRKAIKNLNMRIYPPDGFVRVSAPFGLNEHFIHQFLQSKKDWIKEKKLQLQQRTPVSKNKLVTGESFYILGKRYRLLILSRAEQAEIKTKKDELCIYINAQTTEQQKQSLLDQWCKLHMTEKLPELIEKWSIIIGVKAKEWRIRKMKTRWGSCNVRAKRICLNLRLIHTPSLCMEYVLVHELVHLLEPSHNKRFYALMNKFMPEWKHYKQLLDSSSFL
ncbi:M48 family metallopeptidase [Legionella israelensis]|uniref:Zinc metalloprotease n=1 Tax=Legionella israelensis TaxID=454 RepID=A0A0W0V4G7_9GAMM|nr:SprT family zinc-dependent metalloprotease [Legionella israelensis]KTD15009.1 zinc metalloprotease [Legionella israelensis]QBS09999.1 M48 family peptidase [Legionella israelensis]SCX77918.1 hypothetical protein SAMN02746069_00134 [Legionella israelensis DSM 19235]STX59575.1 zinc metalloprotease [Legionella israelensis]